MTRDEIIAAIQDYCADHIGTAEPATGETIVGYLRQDREPIELFRLMDERTGDWRIGYRTRDGREWFHIFRQCRNAGYLDSLLKGTA